MPSRDGGRQLVNPRVIKLRIWNPHKPSARITNPCGQVALNQTGYQKTDKLLTPKQVALIAHYLGEPWFLGFEEFERFEV